MSIFYLFSHLINSSTYGERDACQPALIGRSGQSFLSSGGQVNTHTPTVLYNDNDACVKWSYNLTLKSARHIELRENSVCEWVQDKTLQVEHMSEKINPADIFTKEMCDGVHFHRL